MIDEILKQTIESLQDKLQKRDQTIRELRAQLKQQHAESFDMPRLIGIAGPARGGKDTCGEYLINKLYRYERMSFADPMKLMCEMGLHMTYEQLYGDRKEEIDERYGKTPRHILQTLGTDWGRHMIHEDLWPKVMMQEAQNKRVIIPDVRYENEASMIREQEGKIIHIMGRGGLYGAAGDHSSEAGIAVADGDIVLNNNGTLEEFYAKIDEMLELHRAE